MLIFVYHIHNRIVSVENQQGQPIDCNLNKPIAEGLYQLAKQYPEAKMVWCHLNYKDSLHISNLNRLFHHNRLMLSFQPGPTTYLGPTMGYIEESVFINVNKIQRYPTWQMSSTVGMVHASVMLAIQDRIMFDDDFDYFLNSVAKLSMPQGLFCYSEPNLLKEGPTTTQPKATRVTVFRFVKQHYKIRWLFLLVLNMMLYERKCPIVPFICSLFYKRRHNLNCDVHLVSAQSSNEVVDRATIDVIIPTIGRKHYLYDVLCDLRNQTQLPENVIIVEQNPEEASLSELDYLESESWPFNIIHEFTHQVGACHARNLAMSHVASEWVFLADDDIRIEKDFNDTTLQVIKKLGVNAVSISCLQKKEQPVYKSIVQWGSFGSGCSFVNAKSLDLCKFNTAYEFGYGEDADFGMQLRNNGYDIIYLPKPSILHLKAPIGGFRTTPKLKWHDDAIQPKPSPTVMLYKLLHQTKEQRQGYKTMLFFKYYKKQPIKNPWRYFVNFKKQWHTSIYWANQLLNT